MEFNFLNGNLMVPTGHRLILNASTSNVMEELMYGEARQDAMKKFDLQHWWNLMAVAGVVIIVTFFIAQLTHGFLLGVGLLLFATGEGINHPTRNEIVRGEIVASSISTESTPWEPNGLGVSMDAVGIGLIGLSLFLVVLAP
jgi:hypothetical protein